MSNYVLHLPEHTWNDLALTEREFPPRKSYSTNVPPAKRKLVRTKPNFRGSHGSTKRN